MTYADGSTYAGEWTDGNKHGSGTFTDANGDKFKRAHNNGQLVPDKRVATLVNGPSFQRTLTAGQTEAVVILNDEHIECPTFLRRMILRRNICWF